jgi:hypothetical protein
MDQAISRTGSITEPMDRIRNKTYPQKAAPAAAAQDAQPRAIGRGAGAR